MWNEKCPLALARNAIAFNRSIAVAADKNALNKKISNLIVQLPTSCGNNIFGPSRHLVKNNKNSALKTTVQNYYQNISSLHRVQNTFKMEMFAT